MLVHVASIEGNRHDFLSFSRFCSDLLILMLMSSRCNPSMMSLHQVKMSQIFFCYQVSSLLNVCNTVFNNVHEFMFVNVGKEHREKITFSLRPRSVCCTLFMD